MTEKQKKPIKSAEVGVPPQPNLKTPDAVVRFKRAERIEHWTFMISFTTLAITGLVQKYSQLGLSQAVVDGLGGIENIRLIHHIAATLMMLVVIYHVGEIIYKLFVQRKRPTMLPLIMDFKSAWQTIKYNTFLSNTPPQQGRYTFEEKLEYWAVVWGTIVMAVTGFMMWNPIATTNFINGQFVPASKIAHGLEAILAVLSILIWHLYHVLVKTLNRSMFNGKLTLHQMEEEHPIEMADLRAGLNLPAATSSQKKSRQRIFWPVYSVVALLGVMGVFWFVSFETTAITTVLPREQAEVFVPLTPTPFPTALPTATPAPVSAEATWDSGIGAIFNTKCAGCHNSAAKIGGLDLTSYQAALAGGNSGPAIVPGDADASIAVTIQAAGGHPGQLSQAELDQMIKWIEAGAPEN